MPNFYNYVPQGLAQPILITFNKSIIIRKITISKCLSFFFISLSTICYSQQPTNPTAIERADTIRRDSTSLRRDSVESVRETTESQPAVQKDNFKAAYATALNAAIAGVKEAKPIDKSNNLLDKSNKTASGKRINDILKKERQDFRKAKNGIKDAYVEAIDELREVATGEKLGRLKTIRETYLNSLSEISIARNIGYTVIYSRFEFDSFRFWPSRNTKFSSLYYKELKEKSSINFLRNQFLNFGEDFGSISSEIVSGHALAFRLSLSTAVARVKLEDIDTEVFNGLTNDKIQDYVDEKNKENLSNATLANVVSGGGQLSFKMQWPLFNINGNKAHALQMDNEFVGDFNGQFAAIGTSIPEDEAILWWGVGNETRLSIPFVEFADDNSLISKFGLFAQYSIRKVAGSDAFDTNLQIDGSFWMNEFKIGLFANGIQIGYTNFRFSNEGLDGKYQNIVSVSFAPR